MSGICSIFAPKLRKMFLRSISHTHTAINLLILICYSIWFSTLVVIHILLLSSWWSAHSSRTYHPSDSRVINSVITTKTVLLFATNLVVMPCNGKYCKTLTLYIGKEMSWHHSHSISRSLSSCHIGANLANDCCWIDCMHFMISEGYALESQYEGSVVRHTCEGPTSCQWLSKCACAYNRDLCQAFEWTTCAARSELFWRRKTYLELSIDVMTDLWG